MINKSELKSFLINHRLSILKIILAFFLLSLIIIEGTHELKEINVSKTLDVLHSIPFYMIFLFFIFGLASTSLMTLYDFIVVKIFPTKLKPSNLFFVSFIATTINNIVGLGGIAGAAIRSYFLKKNSLLNSELLDYNLYVLPATCTGISIFSIITLVNFNIIKPIIYTHRWLLIGILLFIVYLFVYLFMDYIAKFFKKDLFSKELFFKRIKTRFSCIIVSFVEWFTACSLFFLLCFYLNNFSNFLSILCIFSIASIAGILTFMPGGLGSFDLIALLSLKTIGISSEHALAVILLYRLFYFILPALTSLVLFTINFIFVNCKYIKIKA